MNTTFYQVDAFTTHLFSGNPATVCPLDAWLPDEVLQKIAAEMNQPTTAFLVGQGEGFEIRWFSPTHEFAPCGHGAIASAAVVFEHMRPDMDAIEFTSPIGTLELVKSDTLYELAFPEQILGDLPVTPDFEAALGARPERVIEAHALFAVFADETTIREMRPDMEKLGRLHPLGIGITAPGDEDGIDYVSRYFAPNIGIIEDHATGSAQTALGPYWGQRLGLTHLRTRQLSPRGGEMHVKLDGDRVKIAGEVVFVHEGTLTL